MTHRERILRNAFLIMLAAFPVTIVSMEQPGVLQGSTLHESPVMGEVKERARTYRESLMQEARMNTQLREKCRDRASADPTFVCPDYHDRSAVQAFLNNIAIEKEHAAAANSAAALRFLDLSEHDQALLRRYINAGSCPATLKDYSVVGFYDLCRKMVSDSTPRYERKGVTEKVEQRFEAIRSSVEARKARRMQHRKAK